MRGRCRSSGSVRGVCVELTIPQRPRADDPSSCLRWCDDDEDDDDDDDMDENDAKNEKKNEDDDDENDAKERKNDDYDNHETFSGLLLQLGNFIDTLLHLTH